MAKAFQIDHVLRVENLSVSYDRANRILENINITVDKGEMVGLIGRNGAGKSTFMKAVHGVLNVTEGSINLPGGNHAYIPEIPALYEELTLWEHLEIVAMSRGLQEKEFKLRADQLMKQFNMSAYKHHFPGSFSKGMRQKVMLMSAIIAEPELYLIDEPFNGLDALAIKDMLEWLQQEKQRGAAILLSTHVLETAQRICNRFIVLDKGGIIAEGTLTQLQDRVRASRPDLFAIFLQLTGSNRDGK